MVMPVLAGLTAYLAGSIPTSIITCRVLKGIDIREHGSRNAGATNVYRVMGFKVALFVLLIDIAKGVFGVKVASLLVPGSGIGLAIICGLIAILGHVWTVFAGFKGGKGVGTALGVFMALMPVPSLIALGAWILIVALTRIVSVASMSAGGVLFLSALLFHAKGLLAIGTPQVCFAGVVAVLLVFTHRKNISRLYQGTENRLSFGGGKGAAQ